MVQKCDTGCTQVHETLPKIIALTRLAAASVGMCLKILDILEILDAGQCFVNLGASRAEQSRAEQSRAEHSRAQQSRAEHSRAQQSSTAQQSIVQQSTAGQSKVEHSTA